MDPATVQQPQNPVTGDQYVAPENVLIAASHMNEMGRLFEGSGGRFAHAAKKGKQPPKIR